MSLNITFTNISGHFKLVIKKASLCVRRAAVNAAALVDPGNTAVLAPSVAPGAAGVTLLKGTVAGAGAAAAHQLARGAHHEAHQGRQPPPPTLLHAERTEDRIAVLGAAVGAGQPWGDQGE